LGPLLQPTRARFQGLFIAASLLVATACGGPAPTTQSAAPTAPAAATTAPAAGAATTAPAAGAATKAPAAAAAPVPTTAPAAGAAATTAPAAAAKPAANAAPMSLADLAVYTGADREQMLMAGAQKEGGKVVLYTSNSQIEGLMQDFQKKYPFLKVDVLRAMNVQIQQRLTEEFRANNVLADVVESSGTGMGQMVPLDFFQEFVSPDAQAYQDADITKGPGGNIVTLADREIYSVVGYNTNLIKAEDAPKTLDDLLDPRWKGKMGLVSSSTGIDWVGMLVIARGQDYVKQMAQQQFKVQDMTAAALLDLVVSGEIPMSPVMGYADVLQAQAKGAPVQWTLVDPVITTIGSSSLVSKAPHPYSAVLLLDYIHSKQGQEAARDGQQISSPRADVPTSNLPPIQSKLVMSQKFTPDEYAQNADDWSKLFKQYFLTRPQ
jgi:iron(III) transport system substrate-binding protein